MSSFLTAPHMMLPWTTQGQTAKRPWYASRELWHLTAFCTFSPANHHINKPFSKFEIKSIEHFEIKTLLLGFILISTCWTKHVLRKLVPFREPSKKHSMVDPRLLPWRSHKRPQHHTCHDAFQPWHRQPWCQRPLCHTWYPAGHKAPQFKSEVKIHKICRSYKLKNKQTKPWASSLKTWPFHFAAVWSSELRTICLQFRSVQNSINVFGKVHIHFTLYQKFCCGFWNSSYIGLVQWYHLVLMGGFDWGLFTFRSLSIQN